MKKQKLLLVPLILVLLIGSSVISAQGKLGEVGKFFTSQEANVLFGKVISSFSIKANDLRKALDKANDYVLFAIKNNRVVIRDENRNRLSDENEQLDKNETMYIFSKSLVQKLLNSASNTKTDVNIFVEIRPEVLTLTATNAFRGNSVQGSAGDTTLEMAIVCPPICPD